MILIIGLKMIKLFTILNTMTQLIDPSSSCITSNKSTYVIPSAQLCIPEFESEHDGYLFGPCNTTADCDITLVACRFAEYRNNYCILNDAHLCAVQSSGNYTNYYLVECG